MNSRRSPPYKMFMRTSPGLGSLGGDGGVGYETSSLFSPRFDLEDHAHLMEVRLDNHLDDLPSPEELKTTLPRLSRKGCSRVVLALGILLCLFVGVSFVFFYFPSKKSSLLNNQGGRNDTLGSETTTEEMHQTEVENVIAFLLDDVDHGKLAEKTSPQYRAAEWMARDDPRLSKSLDRGFYQRYALAVLWFATGGESEWQHDLNFLSAEHECDWNAPFRRFDHTIFQMGVNCNERKKVVSITMRKY